MLIIVFQSNFNVYIVNHEVKYLRIEFIKLSYNWLKFLGVNKIQCVFPTHIPTHIPTLAIIILNAL